MVTQLQPDVRAYLHGGEVIKRYIRVEEVAHEYGFSVEETEYIAKAASSLYSKRSIVSILTKKYLIASRQVLVCDNDLAVFLTKAIDLPENSDPCHPYDLGFLTANIQNNRMV